jgi:hypothetical protein
MKERIISALINLENECPCGTDCILLFGLDTMNKFSHLQGEDGFIKLDFRGKEYNIKPTFCPSINDDEILLCKY